MRVYDNGVYRDATPEEIEGLKTTIEDAKRMKIQDIEEYDTSENVNRFFFDGNALWLGKADRVGLMNSIRILQAMGEQTTTLWLGELNVTIPCDVALAMLGVLEKYALECYNTTATHIHNVKALDDVEEVNKYDYTKGYPEKIHLTMNQLTKGGE